MDTSTYRHRDVGYSHSSNYDNVHGVQHSFITPATPTRNNETILNDEWLDLNVQQNLNDRINHVQINDCSILKIGKNILNRMKAEKQN